MRIGIDIDGTIRDWFGKLTELYQRCCPDDRINPDDIKHYDVAEFFPIGKRIYELAFGVWAEELYLGAEPYPNSIEPLLRLWRDYAAKHEIIFLSYQPNMQTAYYTDSWLRQQGLPFKTWYTVENDNKLSLLRNTMPDVLIDDSPENLKTARDCGILPIRIRRSWNAGFQAIPIDDMWDLERLIKNETITLYRR